jgi:undecaprenyl phosphate-alpha-L-ara4N flippase subunit ArnE
MLKLIALSTAQSLFLVSGQIFLKFAMMHIGRFSLTWTYAKDVLTCWPLAASGLSMLGASLIWFYILKHYEFSVAYPLISISYVFGMMASIFIFHETVPLIRWIGVFLIMSGVLLVTK